MLVYTHTTTKKYSKCGDEGVCVCVFQSGVVETVLQFVKINDMTTRQINMKTNL